MAKSLKDDSEPKPQPGAGHNALDMLTLEPAQFFAAKRQLEQIEEEMSELRAKKNRIRKDLRASGVILKIFDAVRTVEGLTDDEIVQQDAQLATLRKWMRMPIGHQADMFGNDPELSAEEQAEADGYNSGVAGEPEKDCPYPPNDKEGQAWLRGYNTGYQEFMAAQKDLVYQTNKAVKKEAEAAAAAASH